jgi:hypothetical protein
VLRTLCAVFLKSKDSGLQIPIIFGDPSTKEKTEGVSINGRLPCIGVDFKSALLSWITHIISIVSACSANAILHSQMTA